MINSYEKYIKNKSRNLLLLLSAGPSLEHYHTEYLQGASEAWLKTGKSDLKTDKNQLIDINHMTCQNLVSEIITLNSRLAKRRSILILTSRPVVKHGFNWTFLVNRWSIEVVD